MVKKINKKSKKVNKPKKKTVKKSTGCAKAVNKLTPKQKRFCLEYIVDLNGKQAAIRAKYSEKTAKEQACRLLTNVYIKAEVKKFMDKRADKLEITAERVLKELARLAYIDTNDLYDENGSLKSINELHENVSRCISSIEVTEKAGAAMIGGKEGIRHISENLKKIKTYDKLRALDLLGKHLKLFGDESKDTAPVGPITVKIEHLDLEERIELILSKGKKK